MFDFVIIGSGLGGLQCAYILAKNGFRVCVLEKNRQYGGNLQIFSRDKVIFDTGVHYLGGLDEGQNLYQYFKYFDLIGKLKLRRMDENAFDKITFADDPNAYPHAMGHDNFIENLLPYFPKEKEGLKKYINLLQEVSAAYPLYNVEHRELDSLSFKYMDINAKAMIEDCTKNVQLQNVLAGSNALYAGLPQSVPLYVHALVINSYINSAWKCVNGGGQIAQYLVKSIKSMGGELRNYSKVTEVLFKEGKSATAVKLESGEIIEGKNFIANTHPSQLVDLISTPNRIRPAYRKRMKSLENSISVFTVHIAFKPQSFPYLNYNVYHHNTQDAWESILYEEKDWPSGYALFVPASSKSEKWAEGMNVMAYMRMEEVEQWTDTFNTVPRNQKDRGADYQAFKQERAEKLIDKLEERFPNIRQKIKSYHTSTPLSYRDYIGTSDGSMYGVMKDYRDPLRTFVTPRTKVPNLFLTGQNINVHGILGVTLSSLITCAQFLGLDHIMDKVKAAQ